MTTTATASFPSSYPLGSLVEAPAEWMLDLMADLYASDIKGTHGFGIRHPRARWLRLVVSSVERCDCDDLGRWEDVTALRCHDGRAVVFCPRCAEAEIALVAADRAVPRYVPAYETEPTKVEPFLRDADLPRRAVSL